MNRFTYILILLLLMPITACQDDFLEEEVFTFQAPKDYFSNAEEVVAAANGMYDALMTWQLWVQPAWVAICLENDDMFANDWVGGGYSGSQNGQWYIERPWIGYYQVINRANIVLEQVEPLDFLEPELKNAVLGQAYFMRAFSYYELARRFGDAPIRLSSYDPANDSQDAVRDPRKNVYVQAATDFETAANLLPADFENGAYGVVDRGRPSSPAAWGMLAKVYMHLAGAEIEDASYYPQAISAAQKVVEQAASGFPALESNYMANFEQSVQDMSSEMLFSIQATQQPNEGPELPRYYTPGNTPFSGGGGIGAISMREDFYDTFEDGDKRVEFGSAIFDEWVDLNGEQYYHFKSIPSNVVGLLSENVFDNGFGRQGNNKYQTLDGDEVFATPRLYIKKYVDESSQVKDENGSNPVILRYADVLLLLAEAENEVNGPTTIAYDAVNQVRSRAGLAYLAGGMSQEDFRQAVRDERRHELYGEFQ
ncbi:MAG: RagB/SusD family nutrient uptake outer membrane protein, partial [Bacteroidota bacterium]